MNVENIAKYLPKIQTNNNKELSLTINNNKLLLTFIDNIDNHKFFLINDQEIEFNAFVFIIKEFGVTIKELKKTVEYEKSLSHEVRKETSTLLTHETTKSMNNIDSTVIKKYTELITQETEAINFYHELLRRTDEYLYKNVHKNPMEPINKN